MTAPQGSNGDTITARKANIAKAFVVRTPAKIKDKHIVLIDDVMTSGATLHACAKVLKAAGARRIDCVVIARAAKSL